MSNIVEVVEAIPVAVTSTSMWTKVGTSAIVGGLITGIIGVITLLVKLRPTMRKLNLDNDASMRIQALERIDKLESELAKMGERFDIQRTQYDARIESERAQHEGEIAIMRHRMNNLDQCLTMILMLIEQDPENAQQSAKRVREMRAQQEERETQEKATIQGVKIATKAEIESRAVGMDAVVAPVAKPKRVRKPRPPVPPIAPTEE